MFTRKTRRQFETEISTPPSDGPSPAAPAATAASSAVPCERRSSGKAWSTSASDAGTSIAAPSAWTSRNTISAVTEGASAQAAEASVKTLNPATNIRRRPTRSASRPAATRNAAKTML